MPETQTPKLVILGSASGSASAYRAASAYLLDLGEQGVLLDCGDGVTQGLLAAGYNPDWVSDAFVSHTHADHVGGLSYYLQARYLTGTDNPLTIHCPSEAIEPLQALFRFGYLFQQRMPFTIQFDGLAAGKTCNLAHVAVTPYPTTHLARHAHVASELGYPNRGECFAFRTVVAGRAILYSADLGDLSDLDQVTEPIDWLLIETTHVDLDDLWPWVEARGISCVVLTHIADDFNPHVVTGGSNHTPLRIMIAEDGIVLPIT
jgi:ribonuclease Z